MVDVDSDALIGLFSAVTEMCPTGALYFHDDGLVAELLERGS